MTNDLDRLRSYAELADGLTFAIDERNRLIRRLRLEGYKLETLADAAGIDQSRVSRIAREEQT